MKGKDESFVILYTLHDCVQLGINNTKIQISKGIQMNTSVAQKYNITCQKSAL